MPDTRLTLALESGAASLPAAGRLAVFDAPAEADLSALPKARVQIVQGFAPDHHAWEERGWDVVVEPEGDFAGAVVFTPRAKLAARAMVAQALELTSGGPVIVDGPKAHGIDSLHKAARRTGAEVSAAFAKAHGKLFSVQADPELFAHWIAEGAILLDGRYRTTPGVFSADGVDPGSALLVRALPRGLRGRVADLGAGWGFLAGEALAANPDIAEMHLVEADYVSLLCASAGVQDTRARLHWADVARFVPDAPFDHVLMNPPFHTGRAPDPALGRAFLAAAARMLAPHGSAFIVANRHLPYERDLVSLFGEVQEIGDDPGYKIIRAARPRRAARGGRLAGGGKIA
ncbi:16S rRNA m(2)G 1207 methyltransferase [Rhodovulum sp. ES.010]|uniref:class I SAM-dependent methyltransferase n=1 Tax=Rhodovulum sp. ES.010 TaxID=1882821 RepID=UPI00092C71BD|nr:methyltransferase [Rhodovulum sp. ES.010]SIO53166.1 16S rRNA m(2)G 1207 methyltransferase [Rhodovulum sp. ES.010]